MRVLYFSRGLVGHDHRFLNAFQRHGIAVGFLALHPLAGAHPAAPAGVSMLGSLSVPNPATTPHLLAAVARFRQVAQAFAPDLIIAGPVHDCAFVAAQAKLDCSWLTQSWAFDVFWDNVKDSAAAERTRVVLGATPALFADCAAVVGRCETLASRAGIPHFVMPWGLDRAPPPPAVALRDALRAEMRVTDRTVFLHTRSLEPVYSVNTLLEAFGAVVRRAPDCCLLLAAGGSQRDWVEEQVALMAAPGSVRLLGAVPHEQLLRLYGAADVFVSCAASDGTSVSLLEAMSAGLPAIVNDRGGNQEWITDGQNGRIVPYGDVDRLADAMSEMLALPTARREEMQRISRHRIALRADWSANFPLYVDFLRRLAGKASA